jgi:hypothetical protein
MIGLRVYIHDPIAENINGHVVFYSRREDGPFYRWVFDDRLREWRVGRVSNSAITSKDLTMAAWKRVPVALQTSMVEHYQDD